LVSAVNLDMVVVGGSNPPVVLTKKPSWI